MLISQCVLPLESQGHYGKHCKHHPNLPGPVGRSGTCIWTGINWHDTSEPEEAMLNQPEYSALFEAYMMLAARRRANRDERPDADLQYICRQSQGHRALHCQALSLTRAPELTASTNINTSTSMRIKQGTGACHIQQHLGQPAPVTIYPPTGA